MVKRQATAMKDREMVIKSFWFELVLVYVVSLVTFVRADFIMRSVISE